MTFFRKTESRSFDLLSRFDFFPAGIKNCIFLMLWMGAGFLIATGVGMGLASAFGSDFYSIYANLIIYPLMFIPAFVWSSCRSAVCQSFSESATPIPISRKPSGILTAIFAAVLATLAFPLAFDPVGAILPPMDHALKEALDNIIENSPVWVSVLSVCVMAPFFEEWLCRGMIERSLLSSMKPVWAIVISAAVFGLIHGNIQQGLPAFIIGCVLGYFYYRTGSLIITILMHALNNGVSLLISRLEIGGEAESFYEIMALETYIPAVIAALAVLAYSIFLVRKNR